MLPLSFLNSLDTNFRGLIFKRKRSKAKKDESPFQIIRCYKKEALYLF